MRHARRRRPRSSFADPTKYSATPLITGGVVRFRCTRARLIGYALNRKVPRFNRSHSQLIADLEPGCREHKVRDRDAALGIDRRSPTRAARGW